MSLASDLRHALAPSPKKRAKGLPRRLPSSKDWRAGFGDELMASNYREAVARHQAALATLRASRRSTSAEHRARCRETAAGTRAHAWEIYRAAVEAQRARRRGEVQQAKDSCKADTERALAPLSAELAAERERLIARRKERRGYLHREQIWKPKRATTLGRGHVSPAAVQTDEERQAVRYDLEVSRPDLLPLWDRVGATLQRKPRMTLRETFLELAHDSEEEAEDLRAAAGDEAGRETVAEYERQQREAYGIPEPSSRRSRLGRQKGRP